MDMQRHCRSIFASFAEIGVEDMAGPDVTDRMCQDEENFAFPVTSMVQALVISRAIMIR